MTGTIRFGGGLNSGGESICGFILVFWAEWDVLYSFLGGSTIIFYFILCERLFTVFSTGNEKSMFSADVGHSYVIFLDYVYVFKSAIYL